MQPYKKMVIFFIIHLIQVNVSIFQEQRDTALSKEPQRANILKINGKNNQQLRIERFLLKSYWKMAMHLILTSSEINSSQDNKKKMDVKSKKRDLHKLRIF